MKIGKISETVLKRSVLNQISYQSSEIIKGADVGADCAFFENVESEYSVFSTQTITFPVHDAIKYAIIAAANNIAAGGGVTVGVLLALTLPADTEEEQLKKIMRLADDTCADMGLQIMGGHTEVSAGVINPVINVTAVGRARKNICEKSVHKNHCVMQSADKELAGYGIVVSKWIGLEGSTMLVHHREKEVSKRLPDTMIERLKGFGKYLSIIPEAATAVESGVSIMHDVRGGGIFGALWELSQRVGTGLEIDLKKIPVKQETIELCEKLHINPYELLSGGALLMCTDNPAVLLDNLNKQGIPATLIGSLAKHNDKVVYNDGEVRHLERSGKDEIYRAFNE